MLCPFRSGLFMLVSEWVLAFCGLAITLQDNLKQWKFIELGIYITMGWLAIASPHDMLHSLPWPAVLWMLVGGVAYTAGLYFYITVCA
jgi:hemolysin III